MCYLMMRPFQVTCSFDMCSNPDRIGFWVIIYACPLIRRERVVFLDLSLSSLCFSFFCLGWVDVTLTLIDWSLVLACETLEGMLLVWMCFYWILVFLGSWMCDDAEWIVCLSRVVLISLEAFVA